MTINGNSRGGTGYQPCSTCGGARSRTLSVYESRRCPQCGASNINCPVGFGVEFVTECVTKQEM